MQPAGIFGSLEFGTNSKTGLGEWRRVQTEVKLEQGLYAACDAGKSECPSYLRHWRDALKSWRGTDEREQLERVNAYVNRNIRYTSDRSAFRSADFWASPLQSLKGRGDCEDYAIAKYESLKALGFSESRLRIVVVNDTRKNIGHAVLTVAMPDGAYVLDNQNPVPVQSRSISYYAPVYSINAAGRWINIATRQIAPAVAAGQAPVVAAAPAVKPGIQPATGDLKRILRPTISAGGVELVFTAGNRFAFPFAAGSD